MEEHALVAAREPENRADLVGAEAFDVRKDDHLALRRRQLLDGLFDFGAQLHVQDVRLRAFGEWVGRWPPMPLPRYAGRTEPARVDRRLLAVADRRHGDRVTLFADP